MYVKEANESDYRYKGEYGVAGPAITGGSDGGLQVASRERLKRISGSKIAKILLAWSIEAQIKSKFLGVEYQQRIGRAVLPFELNI